MTWIKTIPYEAATGALKRLYERVKGPDNNVDNILMAHSLRPHSLKGHMALYKNVLHHRDNTFPKWFLETVGVYVSLLNGCDYCVEHHFTGLIRLLEDEQRAQAIREALEKKTPDSVFKDAQLALLQYAEKLTTHPTQMKEADIQQLRSYELNDGEILEVNQIISYFNYANRTVLGLGVSTEGDILGLSPGDNDSEENWSHQ